MRIDRDVGCHVKIQIFIAVDIAEGGRARPVRALYTGSRSDVYERTVAVVAVQVIGSHACDKKIDVAVVVDVTQRGTHAITRIA